MDKESKNQNGDPRTKKPGDALKQPGGDGKRFEGSKRPAGHNSTGKDPLLGNRHSTR